MIEKDQSNKKIIIVIICTIACTGFFLANSMPPQLDQKGMPMTSSFVNHVSKTFNMFATSFQNIGSGNNMNMLPPPGHNMGGPMPPEMRGPPPGMNPPMRGNNRRKSRR